MNPSESMPPAVVHHYRLRSSVFWLAVEAVTAREVAHGGLLGGQ